LVPFVDESPFVSAEAMRESAIGLPRIDFREFREDLQVAIDWEWRDPYERREQ